MSTTLDTIRKEIDGINDIAALREFLRRLHDAWNDDPEVAHVAEDDIKSRVLKLVADGHPDAQAIAREVIVMDEWDVERWYA